MKRGNIYVWELEKQLKLFLDKVRIQQGDGSGIYGSLSIHFADGCANGDFTQRFSRRVSLDEKDKQ